MPTPSYERKIALSTRALTQLDCGLQMKSLDANGRFAGYASVFDLVDNQRDVVLRGAFRETLRGRTSDIKLLWQHQLSEPIGYFTTLFEDVHGLYVEGQLMLEVERAREAYALLKQGVVTGLSIGYSPVRYTLDPDSGIRQLSQVNLYEISLVTMPANEASQVTVVKGTDRDARLLAALDRALAIMNDQA